MTYVEVQHRVKDYDTWKKEFDNFINMRKTSGEKSYTIWRSEEDPNDLSLLFEWDTTENARSFMQSKELQAAMQKAGVDEKPRIRYLYEMDKGTTTT